jgi:hypothetical protein
MTDNNKTLYTAWEDKKEDGGFLLIKGKDLHPKYTAAVQDGEYELLWEIWADNWVEANIQYHKLQGWEPYKQME